THIPLRPYLGVLHIDSIRGSSTDQLLLEYAFGLARANLTKVASYVVSSGGPRGDYTSSCLSQFSIGILWDLRPRLPPSDAVMSELSNDVIVVADPANHYSFSGLSDPLQTRSLRAIPHSMPWRHADSAITEPKPPPGSYDASKARRLSAFVVKLRDMHEGVLVLSGLSRVWRSLTCDAILRHLNKNGTVGAVTFYLSTLLTYLIFLLLTCLVVLRLWVSMISCAYLNGKVRRFRRSLIT
ncbi:hypothetical protein Tco_1356381, partial [Tanacetum coccineum]